MLDGYREAMSRSTGRQLLVDTAIAIALVIPAMMITAIPVDEVSAGDQDVDVYALVLVATAFVSLAVRRRWPMLTLGVATTATSLYLIEGFPYGPILLAFFVAVYTVASQLPLRTAAVSAGVALVIMLSHVWVHPEAIGGALGIVPGSAWVVVPFAIGVIVRMTRESKEAARAEAVRRQLSAERIRLAQEVHDIVGHGLAAIQMQADVALHVDEHQPPKTRTALEAISRASAEAFEELRSTLDLVRDPRSPARSHQEPELSEIRELCKRITDSGVDVDLQVEGESQRLSGTIGRTVYRVVQEALTNVMRHGAEPAASVRLTLDEGSVHVIVLNPGPTTQDSNPGSGIEGMRRRVLAVGGDLEAGPTREGFQVEAHLPLGDRG